MAGRQSRTDPLRAAEPTVPELADKRLLRGARTRRDVLRAAADLASTDGLDGLSFGVLATRTGQSKAGIQTLFGTKQELQLATIRLAGEMFQTAVIEPASHASPGAARINALLERWIAYAETPLFSGGCFWGATRAEQDSRPGPVRDALVRHQAAWVKILASQFRAAVEAGESTVDPDLAAFEVDAVLGSVNIAIQVGDRGAVDKARRVVARLLEAKGR